jgi:hypothetical protein
VGEVTQLVLSLFPGISPRHVLVLMACSSTKRPTPKPVEAIDLYGGPLWQTLRMHMGDVPRINVSVLSGKFGFINGLTRIGPYEARLTETKADRLIERGVLAHNDHHGAIKPGRMPGTHALVEARGSSLVPYRLVLIAGSGPYERVFDSFLQGFVERGLVATDAIAQKTHGGIGEQRQQLGEWLRAVNQPKAVKRALGIDKDEHGEAA